jgi:superfamily I DNA/RNA helicase
MGGTGPDYEKLREHQFRSLEPARAAYHVHEAYQSCKRSSPTHGRQRTSTQCAVDRCLTLIKAFNDNYKKEMRLTEIPRNHWHDHIYNVERLCDILAPFRESSPSPWSDWKEAQKIQRQLRQLFHDSRQYGEISRATFERVAQATREIETACERVSVELSFIDQWVAALDDLERSKAVQLIAPFRETRDRIHRDFDTLHTFTAKIRQAEQLWVSFLDSFFCLAEEFGGRPALQDLDRLRLNDEQEKFVAQDYNGEYRLRGISGSGKTIILIHRAIRLALENPDCYIRVFTINRSLAQLLSKTLKEVAGDTPENLHVHALYDFLRKCLQLFRSTEDLRLVDNQSNERVSVNTWEDFWHHRGQSEEQNVFASRVVQKLIDYIASREAGSIDPKTYLHDEILYVQSAYRKPRRKSAYLDDPRRNRSIPLNRNQRRCVVKILERWEDYRDDGGLCDVDGLTPIVAECFSKPKQLDRIRQEYPTHVALLDEVQDFSTLELSIIRKAVYDARAKNAFFFAGDIEQKVYVKQNNSVRAGFSFQGRAGILRKNFRNTREILIAALNLPVQFPPRNDDETWSRIYDPELSVYHGRRPVVFECRLETQIQLIREVLNKRRDQQLAVLSERDDLLAQMGVEAVRLEVPYVEYLRNEDLDLWNARAEKSSARLALARLEAIKGFEFDTVIVSDLSEGTFPKYGTPRDEYWRQAAILYAALTRARDDLIITFVGRPSPLLVTMLDDMEIRDARSGLSEGELRQVLPEI